MSVHYSILIDYYTILGLNLYQFSWQRLVVTHEMTCWNLSDYERIITIDMKLTKTE